MEKEELFIFETNSIKDALKQLDKTSQKILIVVDKQKKLLGTLSDGDLRRAILKGLDLNQSIKNTYYTNPLYISNHDYSIDYAKNLFLKYRINIIPILDHKHRVIDFIEWETAFSAKQKRQDYKSNTRIELPVVIMAGGKGSRLEPFTHILPKSLIPVKNKSIIEWIINEFRLFGISSFYFTINYKGEMIKAYFKGIKKDYIIKYIHEDDYYGTAGSLKLLDKQIKGSFIVSNCDIIVKADYHKVINFHKKNNAVLTILSSIQHHKIPYGVVEFTNGGQVKKIQEKPEYSLPINTGVYVLNSECFSYIPAKTFFNMTDLIKILIENKKKVLTYPVNENDYIDIGQWEEYRKAREKLGILKEGES